MRREDRGGANCCWCSLTRTRVAAGCLAVTKERRVSREPQLLSAIVASLYSVH